MVSAFTLQICGLFEDGLDDFLGQKYPAYAFKTPGKRLDFLESKKELKIRSQPISSDSCETDCASGRAYELEARQAHVAPRPTG